MSCIIAQAGLFSAALTSFLADSTNNLQVDPAQQMVYYQQQSVALLAQISKQVSSIAPQVSIASTLPPPYPTFRPNPSDVRVNVFWFMSLVFSLFAALLATLVQQWVRDYMHVFQRYSNPLKSARLRQYLYEGAEGWYMPLIAESVPGFVHVSLFLFFIGLGDTLLSLNTTVGVTTIIPIVLCGSLYVLSTFTPIINPQSPFQNPFSGLAWYLKQKVHPRRYLDRASGGSPKSVSSDLSKAQMQLAMEENDGRKDRDVRAIRWLIDNRTEDDEMESFVIAIPGAFASKWGNDIWRTVSEVKQYEDTESTPNDPIGRSQSATHLAMSALPRHHSPLSQRTRHRHRFLHPLGRIFGIPIANGTPREVTATCSTTRPSSESQTPDDLAIYDLCKRVRHLIVTCNNHSRFTTKELWLKRARGCVETVASFVVCANVQPELFGDLESLLRPNFIGGLTLSEVGSDGLFMARLEILTFVIASREMAGHQGRIKLDSCAAIDAFSRFGKKDNDEQMNDDDDGNALRNARRIDDYFETAKQFYFYDLRESLGSSEVGMTEEQVREVLGHDHEAMLERIALAGDQVANIDQSISRISNIIKGLAGGLFHCLRGVKFDILDHSELVQPIHFFNPTTQPSFFPQFIFLYQRLRLLSSYSSKLRDVINRRGNGAYQEVLEGLRTLWGESDKPSYKWSGVRQRHLMERQLWRLQDLRDGGGFGLWVELFFLVARQLLFIPLSSDTQSSLILGLFGVVTSSWRKHKHSIGTLRVILNLICDLAILDRGLPSDCFFPRFLTDRLLVLLENMVEGQSGSRIDEAMRELEDAVNTQDGYPEHDLAWSTDIRLFRAKAVNIISRWRASVSVSSS